MYASAFRGRPPRDPCLLEIVALAACGLSYLAIVGKPSESIANLTVSKVQRDSGSREVRPQESTAKSEEADTGDRSFSKGVERLAPPILAALTTSVGIVGASFAGPATSWHLDAVLAGIVVYALSLISVQFISRRESKSELQRNLTVTIDWTESRLERELPSLLRRVKHARFAPIFILDELDKLENQIGILNDFL